MYEHLTFDGRRHIPLMTLPGMRERAVRIGSAGKTLSLTGWKIGYVTAAPRLLQPIAKAHQFNTFTSAPNLQKAVAYGLAKGDDVLRGPRPRAAGQARPPRGGPDGPRVRGRALRGDLLHRRRHHAASVRPMTLSSAGRITTEAGVAAVPMSVFYDAAGGPTNFVRLCFCKRDEVLDAAVARLATWLKGRRRATA